MLHGIYVAADSPIQDVDDLIAFINETIEELKASGELEKLYQEACAQAIDQLSE